jgi:hypothetical protein
VQASLGRHLEGLSDAILEMVVVLVITLFKIIILRNQVFNFFDPVVAAAANKTPDNEALGYDHSSPGMNYVRF